jgi:hypothetical protein
MVVKIEIRDDRPIYAENVKDGRTRPAMIAVK